MFIFNCFYITWDGLVLQFWLTLVNNLFLLFIFVLDMSVTVFRCVWIIKKIKCIRRKICGGKMRYFHGDFCTMNISSHLTFSIFLTIGIEKMTFREIVKIKTAKLSYRPLFVLIQKLVYHIRTNYKHFVMMPVIIEPTYQSSPLYLSHYGNYFRRLIYGWFGIT